MFESTENDGVQLIRLGSIVEDKEGHQLEAAVKSWLLSTMNVHILDMAVTTEVKQSAYRHFLLFNQALKSNGKTLFCINVNPRLTAQFKQEGLTSVFLSVASIEEAKRRSKSGGQHVDVEFINPFIAATQKVLETQAQLPLTAGKAYLRKPSERIPMEIAGVIGLNCSEFKGSISLCFRAEVFLKIYEGMVGEKHEMITSEIQDAAGELLNIIFGHAKTVLNDQKGFTLNKSLPTVLVGEKLKIHHQSRSPAIILPFESPAGSFHLEILVDRNG